MTLLIAGYVLEFDNPRTQFAWAPIDSGDFDVPSQSTPQPPKPSAIFVAVDSAITSGSKTLLNGFDKTATVACRLMQPYFVGQMFRSYQHAYMQFDVLLAFAGSTLTAHHCLNLISRHLSDLRISCADRSGPVEYVVLMHCDPNPLNAPCTEWDEDMFMESDFDGLLTAARIAEVIEHALNVALQSARTYKLDAKDFETLNTPFIAGIQCPSRRTFHLYLFEMSFHDDVSGMKQVTISKNEIRHDQIAVLGKVSEFKKDAELTYEKVIKDQGRTDLAMFQFLNEAIDKVSARHDADIARPAILKLIDRRGVRRTERRDS